MQDKALVRDLFTKCELDDTHSHLKKKVDKAGRFIGRTIGRFIGSFILEECTFPPLCVFSAASTVDISAVSYLNQVDKWRWTRMMGKTKPGVL